MKTRPTGQYFMLGILLIGLVLDVFDVWGRNYAPNTLAHTACGLRPFAMIASPFVANQLIDFVNTQCFGESVEPTFSIIFFMTKLSLALVTFLIFWGFVYLKPANFIEGRDQYFQALETTGTRLKTLKKSVFQILWLSLIFLFGIVYIAAKTPERYVILPIHKFFEDAVAGLTFYMATVISLYAAFFLSFLFRRTKDRI